DDDEAAFAGGVGAALESVAQEFERRRVFKGAQRFSAAIAGLKACATFGGECGCVESAGRIDPAMTRRDANNPRRHAVLGDEPAAALVQQLCEPARDVAESDQNEIERHSGRVRLKP